MQGRRELLIRAAASGLALAAGASPAGSTEKPAEINATEDLMREHGILRRLLLVYEEGVRRLHAGDAPPAELFASPAALVRRFVEDYHERLEETELFPRLLGAGRELELVRILKDQHAAGRKLTAVIAGAATFAGLRDARRRGELVRAVEAFVRMYRPHAAREDTVLFPAFHALFNEAEFDRLGDRFEAQEHKLLGPNGFEAALGEVAGFERALGIHDLSRFTP